MPQFDTFSFLSQLSWFFLVFFLFYAILCASVLPSVAMTLKLRKRVLQNNVFSSAQSLDDESSSLAVNYESFSYVISRLSSVSDIAGFFKTTTYLQSSILASYDFFLFWVYLTTRSQKAYSSLQRDFIFCLSRFALV